MLSDLKSLLTLENLSKGRQQKVGPAFLTEARENAEMTQAQGRARERWA